MELVQVTGDPGALLSFKGRMELQQRLSLSLDYTFKSPEELKKRLNPGAASALATLNCSQG